MTRPGRKTLDIPASLHQALDDLARERGRITSELAAAWLYERLKQEQPDQADPYNPDRVPDPVRWSVYPRRERQVVEGHMEQAYANELEEHQAYIANERGEA